MQGFIEPAQMHAVDKPVVDLNGKAQRFAAVFLPDYLPQVMRGMASSMSTCRSFVQQVRSNHGRHEI